MADEKIDVEMQDTGEFLTRIHTATGTDEIVLMFDDAENHCADCEGRGRHRLSAQIGRAHV